MPWKQLLNQPLYRPEDLGKPIPPTPHAVSMCLPRWRDVVGYEERDPETMQHLWLGYPRFFYHPLVERAVDVFQTDPARPVQIYTTQAAAQRCRAYLLKKNTAADVQIRSMPERSETLIEFPKAAAQDAKDYWQHAGEGISSRAAEELLDLTNRPDADVAQKLVLARLAEFSQVPEEYIYLFPSGMAAIHAAHLAVRQMFEDKPTAQFAFPYGDTLKLQQKLGDTEPLFFAHGDADDLAALQHQLQNTAIAGLFCEFPTNPLLNCIDLPRLRSLADAYDFPIIVDETLGACINLDCRPYADVSIISLTKFFSGSSNVMGGALLIQPDAPFAKAFEECLKQLHDPRGCHPADILRLEADSENCRDRVEQINQTTLDVCRYLDRHPAVETVYYPAFKTRAHYDQIKRPDGGYGGLFSFVLKDPEQHAESFYDALEICKGPNLGTNFSLCCPFTLIAHYNELDWAEAAGASRWLIRISIGLEPADELIQRLESALEKSR